VHVGYIVSVTHEKYVVARWTEQRPSTFSYVSKLKV